MLRTAKCLQITPISPLKKSLNQKLGATAGLSSSVSTRNEAPRAQAGSGTRLIQPSALYEAIGVAPPPA